MSKKGEGYVYSRYGNPNTEEVENKIAKMESYGIEGLKLGALLFASG
jgi:O-acetylhomoserine/O-acetylserine sulfhydrylase-like pyridoxal-dependent enzyme